MNHGTEYLHVNIIFLQLIGEGIKTNFNLVRITALK